MKTTSQECITLGEYRREVMKVPQRQIAKDAKCSQGWVTQIECGHLPQPWNRAVLLSAYELDEPEFIRLVQGANKTKAITQPISEDMPLFSMAEEQLVKEIVRLAALRVQEERKAATA